MAYSDSHNVIGAMALALADVVRVGTRGHAPKNITAAAITLVGHDPGLSIQELSNALELSHSGAVASCRPDGCRRYCQAGQISRGQPYGHAVAYGRWS